tara:strand:- start:2781 stop:3929 length:1149 start_codon:yes stop_codon:yes gene_type:complete
MIRICVYTTNRAEYSKLRPILKLLQNDDNIELSLLVTGSHLLKQYGESKNQIIKDGIKITEEIYTHIAGDDITKTVETIGLGLIKLPSILKRINPHIILCGFDRFDMYPFAITAALMNYCLVHIEGGEITGTLDEKIRHSISKLSNYHFVSTEYAKNNLIKMGEYADNIFVTGCPRYDELINIPENNDNILKNYNVIRKKYYIFCYHPVSSDIEVSYKEWTILLQTLIKLKENVILIKPNIDYGNEKLWVLFEEMKLDSYSHINIYNHIDIDDFSILLKNCCIIIGNSSGGIREACVFGTPVINIGTRQQYRVLDTLVNVHNMINFDIDNLMDKIMYLKDITYDTNFIFGSGNASYNIVKILKQIDYTNSEKVISYSNSIMN